MTNVNSGLKGLNCYQLQVGENYAYLLNQRPNISEFRCLNTRLIPNNSAFRSADKANLKKND